LAKAIEDQTIADDPTNSPTMTMSPTRADVIVGTGAYMRPEQARRADVDKGVDIWAFGCVLYEMLAGKQAFHGATVLQCLYREYRRQLIAKGYVDPLQYDAF
jgi:serine/threonine protein kinase